MRFANGLLKISLLIVLAHAMTGCALLERLNKNADQPNKTPAENAPVEKIAKAPLATPTTASSVASDTAATASKAKLATALPPPEPPVNPVAQRMFDDANRALKAGRINEAEQGYRSIIQSHPELGGPHANLGVIYRNANKLPDALGEFSQAVRLSPKQPAYLNQLGITYRQMGQFDKARDAYEQAITFDANYATAILNLGILNDMYLDDSKRALDLFVRYLALMPNGDATVSKWVAELKNRRHAAASVNEKEKS